MPESDSTAFFFEFDETAIVSPGFQRLLITIIQSRWLAGGWASKAKEEASMLNVQLLGTPSFRILDRPAGGELGKAGRLLGSFLFTFANQPFRRDHLQDLFWGDLSVERGRAALNTAIWRLRKLLSAPPSSHIGCLSVERHEIELRTSELLSVDSLAFTAQARELLHGAPGGSDQASRLQACADIHEGPFLDGEDSDWVLIERERLQSLHIQVLSRLARLQTSLNRYDDAITTTRRILRTDPYRESAHRDLLILFGLNGERVTAIRHFERLSVMLRQELGLQPTTETMGLIGAMRQEDYRGHFERLKSEYFRQSDIHV
jgi:DNA-binding SARP family transcriptional activator